MVVEVGLTQAEARRRLAEQGPNRLPGPRVAGAWALWREVLAEPMNVLLTAAGAVYLALGDRGEAALMLGFVGLMILIAWVQARRTQRALAALRDLSAPRARVVREGAVLACSALEVVAGDLLVLSEGDRVVADGTVVEGLLGVDESLLTGESVAVTRTSDTEGMDHVSAGTLVVAGQARVRVTATGERTALGRLGRSLVDLEPEPTGLQHAARRVVRRIAVLGGLLAGLVTLLGWAWAARPWLDSLLQGLAFAMAILPQEIPVVLTVFLAMGALRLSRHRVLARRIPAVEALGAVTVLAVDKTGTLTQNRMAVAELRVGGVPFRAADPGPLPEAFHPLLEVALLATPETPFDPMEQALQTFAQAHLAGTEHLHADWRTERAYDLSRDILAVTRAYPDGQGYLLAAKGAPEAVADLCHLPEAELAQVRVDAAAMAEAGLRVLGVAHGRFEGEAWPPHQHHFDYRFLGLLGLEDPLRPEVPGVVAACRAAGIRVLMLTGDHPATARAIARQAGLATEGPILSGPGLEALDDAALMEALRTASLCARVRPEHKLRLVRALRAMGEVVAMTGDGVNDAPALLAADVGVAMGARGTEVAREAAALVLLDDSFASLVEGIRQGRRVFQVLVQSVRFILAVHMPVVLLSFLALALKWPPLLLPAHIVLMELIIDPACSVVLEAEPGPEDLMARPPRLPEASPFQRRVVLGGLAQGSGVAGLLMLLAGWGHQQGWDAVGLRSTVVAALVACAFLLVLASRDPAAPLVRGVHRNPWVVGQGLLLGTAGLLVAAVPGLRHALDLGTLPSGAGIALGGTVLACAAWLEGYRRLAVR